MELLILKNGADYLRIRDEEVQFTTMNKASVFPLKEERKVINTRNQLLKTYPHLEIRKLVITETEFISDFEDNNI